MRILKWSAAVAILLQACSDDPEPPGSSADGAGGSGGSGARGGASGSAGVGGASGRGGSGGSGGLSGSAGTAGTGAGGGSSGSSGSAGADAGTDASTGGTAGADASTGGTAGVDAGTGGTVGADASTGGTAGTDAGPDGADAPLPCSVQVAAGALHTCARKADNSLYCWGRGELGNGGPMVPSQPTPVAVTALGTNVIRVAAGTTTCAIRQGGSLWCWGNNLLGQVGDGTSSGDELVDGQPHRILPQQLALSNIVSVAAGAGHTCAVEAGGDLHCWGSNSLGQIGNATTTGSACGSNVCRPSPTRVTALSTLVADVAVGGRHTCAVTKDGRLYCWGENTTGQLGTGSTGGESCQPSLPCRSSPAQVTALGNDVAQVAAGGSHTCAVLKNGTLWCWGVNSSGQVGNGTQTGSQCTLPGGSSFPICVTSPAQVTALGANVAQVVTAGDRTCARLKDRSLWCWGDNAWGEIGAPTDADAGINGAQPLPVRVVALGNDVTEVAISVEHSCARTHAGSVWCWGNNTYGQVGDGTTAGSDCRFNGHCRLAPTRSILCDSP